MIGKHYLHEVGFMLQRLIVASCHRIWTLRIIKLDHAGWLGWEVTMSPNLCLCLLLSCWNMQDSFWSRYNWHNIWLFHVPNSANGWSVFEECPGRRNHSGQTLCRSLQVNASVCSFDPGLGFFGLLHRTSSQHLDDRQLCIEWKYRYL